MPNGERVGSEGRLDDRAPSWPADRAFVVRFRASADPARGVVVGRIEHVVSGRGQRFSSYDEMADFVAEALRR